MVQQIEEAARALGLQAPRRSKPVSEANWTASFASLVQLGVGALLVAQEPSYIPGANRSSRSLHVMPFLRRTGSASIPAAGGLMSYDASWQTRSVRSASMSVAFSKARSPPTCQSAADQVRAGINLKTAKALGLTFPPTLLAPADEVIE